MRIGARENGDRAVGKWRGRMHRSYRRHRCGCRESVGERIEGFSAGERLGYSRCHHNRCNQSYSQLALAGSPVFDESGFGFRQFAAPFEEAAGEPGVVGLSDAPHMSTAYQPRP